MPKSKSQGFILFFTFHPKCQGLNIHLTPVARLFPAIYRVLKTPFMRGQFSQSQPTKQPTNPKSGLNQSDARCAENHFSRCAALNLREVISQLSRGIRHTCTTFYHGNLRGLSPQCHVYRQEIRPLITP